MPLLLYINIQRTLVITTVFVTKDFAVKDNQLEMKQNKKDIVLQAWDVLQ